MGVLNDGQAFTKGILGIRVSRATAALPATTTVDLFSVDGGRVMITAVIGEVTTAIQNQANNTKLSHDPDNGGSDVDLCAVLDIANDAVGEMYSITGDFSDALKSLTNALETDSMLEAAKVVVGAGDIKLNCAATNTGSVKWDLWYIPLDDGAVVTAV